MDALSHLRHMIASLDETLVDALCLRAGFRLNTPLYALPAEAAPVWTDLAAPFARAPSMAARIRLLRPAYLRLLLPPLCPPGVEDTPAACLAADAACLEALARRLALSVHVATRKRESLPDDLQAAIRTGDPVRVEQAITHPAVEEEVLARVRARAARFPAPALSASLAVLYRDGLIPLSRRIQVYGLLAGE